MKTWPVYWYLILSYSCSNLIRGAIMCKPPQVHTPPNQTPSTPTHPSYKAWFWSWSRFHPTNNYAPYSTSTDSRAFFLNQHLQPISQNKVTGARILPPLRGYCGICRLLPLLHNITLHNDILLGLNIFLKILPCPSLNL